MEPVSRRGRLHCSVFSRFHRRRLLRLAQHGGRARGRRAHHGQHVPPRLPAPDAGVHASLRGQRQPADAEAVGRGPADPAAAHRRAGGRGRGQTPGPDGLRRRGRAADLRDPRLPAERRVCRRTALRADPGGAEPAAHQGGVRGQPAPVAADRQVARGADRMGGDHRRGTAGRVHAAQREGESRARGVLRRPHARPGVGDRRRRRRVLRVAQGGLPHRRAAQDQVRPGRRRAIARARGRAAGRSREVLPRQRAAVHDGRTGARQPHPAQDRGQGRGGGEGEGRGPVEAGQRRRRLCRAGKEGVRGRPVQGAGRRPRLLRPRPHGEGIRGGGLQPARRSGERDREVVVRLSHHQGHRQEARGQAIARRGAASRSPTNSRSSARRPRPPRWPTKSSRTPGHPRISSASRSPAGWRSPSRACSHATSRLPRWGRPRKSARAPSS